MIGKNSEVKGRGASYSPAKLCLPIQWGGSKEKVIVRWEDGLGSRGWGGHLVFFQELELDGHISPQLLILVPMGLERSLGALKSTSRPCIPGT